MTIKILANDGINPIGEKMLQRKGFLVESHSFSQEDLLSKLSEYQAIIVRSSTKVRKDLIDACPRLQLIGRAGVGMDNIDVQYAKNKGIAVMNTPLASSLSVAELVFAHLLNGVRFLYRSNRKMPSIQKGEFPDLKRSCASGTELRGKVLGIFGFGRIGKEVAKIGIALGMDVWAYDRHPFDPEIKLRFYGSTSVKVRVKAVDKDELLQNSDFISLNLSNVTTPEIGVHEFSIMKDGGGLINTSRGSVLDEKALIKALNTGKLSFAGLDVFENEPNPSTEILQHPLISLSPHIGASTKEAQERIWIELAQKIISHFQR